ncbi:MAG: efflux RND transporter periplasmic adaptor subunit [Campylobacterales bacterium]|nr:efflux RND transporter periplasmic adaptor subunit [Campylobacterales bacterium]
MLLAQQTQALGEDKTSSKRGNTVEQLFNVQTVEAKKKKMGKTEKHYGFVKADQSRVYAVAPRFDGFVVELYADTLYKKIQKGQPLALVYSPEVFRAKEEYLNTLSYVRKHPNASMLESARLKLELLGISEEEIEKVRKSGKTSANTMLYAPAEGYLFMKGIEKGSAFNAKSTLFRIVNLDEVWVEAKLFEEDRRMAMRSTKHILSFKGMEETYMATKVLLYPELDPKEATLTLRLSIENKAHKLFPGMYARVDSVLQTQEYLMLPSSAVIRKNGKHYVFVEGEYEGEYAPVQIEATPFDSNSYIVTEGLIEGERVVNNALFMMDSDAQINGLY